MCTIGTGGAGLGGAVATSRKRDVDHWGQDGFAYNTMVVYFTE